MLPPLGELLPNEEIAPSTLLKALIQTYGPESLGWDPLAIRLEVAEDGYTNIPGWAWDKLFAAKMANISTAPWKEWAAFLACSQAFNNNPADFIVARLCSPAELAWAVTCLKQFQPEEEFGDDIQGIMAAILLEEGIVLPPPNMEFLVDELARLQSYNPESKAFATLAREAYEAQRALKEFPDKESEDPIATHTVKMLAIDAYLALWKSREEAMNNDGVS